MKLTDDQVECGAIRLFLTDLPRRSRRKLLAWKSLQEHERDYYRWAVRSIIAAAFGLETIEPRRVGVKHGHSPAGRERPEYRAWIAIKSRCFNPKHNSYGDYGARGITICDEWKDDFVAFFKHVGPRPSPKHSIDRYPDNDGNYEPGNVRWATKLEQQANRRTTVFVMHEGKKIAISEACRLLNLNRNAVWMRMSRGATPEEAIERTIRSYQRRASSCG